MKTKIIDTPLFFAPLVPVVLNDKRLSAFDRVLIAVIIELAKLKGYCFASNAHFAANLNCSLGAVSKSINKMYRLGYIIKNSPNPKDGGRAFHRTIRADLIYKPEVHNCKSRHANKTNQPSEKDIRNYIMKEQTNDNNKKLSSETEKRLVNRSLTVTVPDKFKCFEHCKTVFDGKYPILWDLKNIGELIALLNKLNAVYGENLKTLPVEKQNENFVEIFDSFITHKPKFMENCLPKAFIKYFDTIIGQQKFLSAVKYLIRSEKEHGFY